MMYAKLNVDKTAIIGISSRPNWLFDGAPVADDVLAAGGYSLNEAGELEVDEQGKPILATGREGWVPLIQPDIADHNEFIEFVVWNEPSDWLIENDKVIKTYTIQQKNLISLKEIHSSKVDEMAEHVRSNFLTQGGPGQALEYDETRREADRWAQTNNPSIIDFPMLNAEYKARLVAEPDITPEEVVSDTIQEISIWHTAGSAIKEIRRTAKVAMEIAETGERVQEIVEWATTAFQTASLTGQFEPLPST